MQNGETRKGSDLLEIYNAPLREAQKNINKAFGYIQTREIPLTQKELDEAFELEPSLKGDVSFFLAYLENIGLAIKHNVASFEMIYDLMANTYLKYYYLFKIYITNSRNHNPRLWENIEFLANELEKERLDRKEKPVRLRRIDS